MLRSTWTLLASVLACAGFYALIAFFNEDDMRGAVLTGAVGGLLIGVLLVWFQYRPSWKRR